MSHYMVVSNAMGQHAIVWRSLSVGVEHSAVMVLGGKQRMEAYMVVEGEGEGEGR